MTLRNAVYEALTHHPELAKDNSNQGLYELFPEQKKSSIKAYKWAYLKNNPNLDGELAKFIKNNQVYPLTQNPFRWQCEAFKVIMENDVSKLLIPRETGKSWLLCYIMEYFLDKLAKSVLLIGWTKRIKDLAIWVYNYCLSKDLIGDYRSDFNFTLKNGARFFCEHSTSRAFLGFHDIGLLVMDDVMDETFIYEQSKEERLERHYTSTIAPINPEKIIISGTRKGEKDFFAFIDKTYRDLEDVKYAEYVRTPYLDGNRLLCPEIWTHAKLEAKRAEIGEYDWFCEYMQNPFPPTAGMFEDPEFGIHDGKSAYSHCAISVDSAMTTKKSSDFTAIICVLKVRNKLEYFVIRAIVAKLDFESILNSIERSYKFINDNFVDINIIVPIETNNGGNYIIQSAKKRAYSFSAHIIPVHQSKNKVIRIESSLECPLRDHTIIFSEGLRGSELVKEIETFPYCRKVDAVDSLAMAILELEKKHIKHTFSFAKANGL